MAEHDICSYFKHIWEREEKHANNTLSAYGLTLTQSYALDYIVERGGTATQKELEDRMEIQHSAVVGIVARLEAKGMIATAFSTQDRRQKLLIPTERGRATFAALAEDKEKVQRDLIRGFSEAEIPELEQMLARIYKNLAEE